MEKIEQIEQIEIIIKKIEQKFNEKFGRSDIKVTYIEKGIYSIEAKEKNRIGFYIDSEGNNIASPVNERKYDDKYKEKLQKLGYKEEKKENEYIMIKLSDNSKVDKYSLEYFNIFLDLRYIDSLKYVSEALNSKKRLSRSQALELIPTFISARSLKINELESFLTRGSITKEDFANFLPKMKVLLKEQTIDKRGNMKKFGKEVTEEEIKEYFEKGYIDINLVRELYEIIKKREEKQQEKSNILNNSQSSLEGEKNEYKV